MTSFYYVVLFDEKKSEHEESKTPPQRRMSLLYIGQKRFMKSHFTYVLVSWNDKNSTHRVCQNAKIALYLSYFDLSFVFPGHND